MSAPHYGRDGLMAIAAFRYCLGRQTYIVGDCAEWLCEQWPSLPRWMAEWIAEQCAEGPPYKTATQLIEAAMVKAYKLRPPKE